MSFFLYDTFQTFGVFKRTSDHKRYYHPQSNTRRERLAASRDKNRATWRTAGVLAVKIRLKDYRLFRANYGTVLQYWFLAQPTREKSQVIYSGTTVDARLWGTQANELS